jgi:hypothetical protein
MRKTAAVVFFGWYSILLLPSPAQAYLDPGSGSMLLQLLLGGVAGLTVLLKLFWHRVREVLGLSAKEERASSAAQLRSDAGAEPRGKQRS